MRANSFIEINDKNFNKIFCSTIKKNFKKVAEFILKNKDDVNSSVHESLSYKQENKIGLDVKV